MKKARSFAQQLCLKKCGLVMHKTAAIYPHCRIGIALSGGVDSFVLLQALALRQKMLPFPVEIMALHLDPGFTSHISPALVAWLAQNGIAGHLEVTNFGPRAHSNENRSNSACFYCAWLRRKRLFELCTEYHLSHLAMGHNADDLAATFLLNALRAGRIQGLTANESFFSGKLHLIRPLLLVEKKYIRQAAKQWRLPIVDNKCPSSGNTSRSEMEKLLAEINDRIPGASKSLLTALGRWEMSSYTKPEAGSQI